MSDDLITSSSTSFSTSERLDDATLKVRPKWLFRLLKIFYLVYVVACFLFEGYARNKFRIVPLHQVESMSEGNPRIIARIGRQAAERKRRAWPPMELYENSSIGMSLALGCIFAFYATLFMWRAGIVIFFVVFVALGFGVLMGALPRGMIIYYFDHYG